MHLVAEGDAIKLVRVHQQLGAERGGYELRIFRHARNHVGHGCAMGCVQCLVNLVKEVKRCRIAALDGEYQSKRLEWKA